ASPVRPCAFSTQPSELCASGLRGARFTASSNAEQAAERSPACRAFIPLRYIASAPGGEFCPAIESGKLQKQAQSQKSKGRRRRFETLTLVPAYSDRSQRGRWARSRHAQCI